MLPPVDYDSAVSRNEGLGQLFLDQAQSSPSAVAVIDGESSLTYGELHSVACRLGAELFRRGLAPEEPVGVVVQHGIADIAAQLAVIYAGGSCVPLDPGLSDELVNRRLQRLSSKQILVDATNSRRALPFTQVLLDWTVHSADIEVERTFPVLTRLSHRSHIIHTSGTTSEPKAVQIAARSILQVVFHAPFEPVWQTDVVAHVNNSSFDVSLFDIWGPLLRGARIAVLHKLALLDLPLMAQHIVRLGITVMATTTALLNLAATTFPNVFAKLRLCFIGGEAANTTAIGTILQAGPPKLLINAYGPTECCVWSLARQITRADVEAGAVSIGKPIGQTIIHIADSYGRSADEGELWIGGPGVSPGYINHPESKGTAFTTARDTPMRFYRTGDIVRRRLDGQIDYIGRLDHQVKVRGFRVDLGAVESGLLRTGLFSEAVAIHVQESQDGAGSILAAYVIPLDSSYPLDVSHTKQLLATILPDYMIPQHFEVISKIPLNSHSKVDRKCLLQLFRDRWEPPELRTTTATSDTRTTLGELWARILPTPRGYKYRDTADFFRLGGTSIQASLLISQIHQHLGLRIPLLTLYDNATLGSLAQVVDSCAKAGRCETVRDETKLWLADSNLADDIHIPPDDPVNWRSDIEGRIFLTGATGFVGAFLVAQLLRLPHVCQIGCLVRAPDASHAMERVRGAMRKYGLWEKQFQYKLLVFPGDLEVRYLGLGRGRFNEVARWASVVFHLGARVNYTQPYALHRPANTIGTLNVLRFAFAGRAKAVHYLSSISCFGPTGYITGTRSIDEDEALLPHLEALPYDHGYAQSQWVVEQLLRRLMDQGAPIAVYRPGFITGHSQTGACNPDDFFSRLIQACQEMKCYPRLPNQRKEFVPVDYVNSAFLHIASDHANLGRAYHLVPPDPALSIDMDATMELIATASGCEIRGLPYAEWVDILTEKTPERLQPLQPMLVEQVHEGHTRWELYDSMPTYRTTNTQNALAGYPAGMLDFPVLGESLMKRYIAFLASYSPV
ncbi:acetyl-CoA synthetase-like protein [Aspergillus californicus]